MNARPVRTLVRLGIALLGALLAACVTPRTSNPALIGGDLDSLAGRLILVTVANPPSSLPGTPGSTPHGYDHIGPYAAGAQARVTAAALARGYGLQPLRAWPIESLQVHCLVFQLPRQADRAAILRRLNADRRVTLAQPFQLFNALAAPAPAHTYNDPYFSLQRNFVAIDAAGAQRWSVGAGVRVAIIDTGVDVTHAELAGRVAETRNFIDQDMHSFDSDRHGTAVAGIIGALANNHLGMVGIAPSARLLVYKACQPLTPGSLAARCNSFTLALALNAAIQAHAQIVNLSLGGPADPLLTQLVHAGQRRGMVFVGAVPEDGSLRGFPVSIAGVIDVAATSAVHPASTVLYAPGQDILSLAPGGRYDFASGSSFATAQVTGALALLLARAPRLDVAQLFTALDATESTPVSAPASNHSDSTINICAALSRVQQRDRCATTAPVIATTRSSR